MVHNGIEYGDMQLICEAYHLMKDVLGMDHDDMAAVSHNPFPTLPGNVVFPRSLIFCLSKQSFILILMMTHFLL